MHLLGKAKIVIPEWEPDQGWRVLDPDGHVVNAGPRTILYATFEIPGFDDIEVPLLGTDRNGNGSH
jgi:hypothetical protein